MSKLTQKNGHSNGHGKEPSDLYKIEIPSDNPFDLFRKWLKEAEEGGVILPQALNLATSDGTGRVSSRTLIMRKLVDDGFLIMTDKRSKKSFDISKNQRVAVTFLWIYPSSAGTCAQQVRVEGYVSEVSFGDNMDIYSTEPLFCQIRALICRQGEVVEWDEHKKHHDRIYKQYLAGEGKNFDQPPEHYVLYKIHPEMMEFYMATGATVADRVVFRVADQPHMIPAQVTSKTKIQVEHKSDDGIEQLEKTFTNGLKISTGVGEVNVSDGGKKWVHYNICA